MIYCKRCPLVNVCEVDKILFSYPIDSTLTVKHDEDCPLYKLIRKENEVDK